MEDGEHGEGRGAQRGAKIRQKAIGGGGGKGSGGGDDYVEKDDN